jgi:hypothetical protein
LTTLAPKLHHFCTVKSPWWLNPINEATYVEVTIIMLKIAYLTGSSPITTYTEYIIKSNSVLLQSGNVSSEDRKSARSMQPTFPECSALFKRAMATRELYIAATTGHIDQLQELITSAIIYDLDIACDALEHIPIVWNVRESKVEDLIKLIDIYVRAHSATSSDSIRTIVLRNLADILEYLSQSGWLNRTNITSTKFRDFELSLLRRGSPELTNAEIRISGSLLSLDFLRHTPQDSFNEIAERIQAWADMLSENSKSENVSIRLSLAQTSYT